MIELKLTGCCKNCRYSDLELKKYSLFFDLNTDARYRVTCKHEEVCGALLKEKEELNHEDLQSS